MGQRLYYSHRSPAVLSEQAGFSIEAAEHRSIGGETFLWVRAIRNCQHCSSHA